MLVMEFTKKKKKRMKLPKNLNSQTHMAYFSKKKKKRLRSVPVTCNQKAPER